MYIVYNDIVESILARHCIITSAYIYMMSFVLSRNVLSSASCRSCCFLYVPRTLLLLTCNSSNVNLIVHRRYIYLYCPGVVGKE